MLIYLLSLRGTDPCSAPVVELKPRAAFALNVNFKLKGGRVTENKKRQPPIFDQYRITEKDLGKTQITVGGRVLTVAPISKKDVGKIINVNRRLTN